MTNKKQITSLREITPEAFSEWKDSEVTQLFYKLLEVELEIASFGLSALSGSVEEIGTEYIRKKAYMQACSNIMDLTFHDLNYVIEESEHEL